MNFQDYVPKSPIQSEKKQKGRSRSRSKSKWELFVFKNKKNYQTLQ